MGRPSKYNEEMQRVSDAYCDGEYENHGDMFPSKVGLACVLRVSERTLDSWGKEYPEFGDTLALIQANQHRTLLNKGLLSEFNPTICKLALHNHGYSDKIQQEDIGPDRPVGWTLEVVAKDPDGGPNIITQTIKETPHMSHRELARAQSEISREEEAVG